VRDPHTFDALANKIKAIAAAPLPNGEAAKPPAAQKRPSPAFKPDGRVVAIGSSTGGVEALLAILSEFPENCPPTVITQHMPPVFTASFAARLDRLCRPHVSEAVDGAPIRPGHIYVAPGGRSHLEVIKKGGLQCRLIAADAVNGHRPSIDVLFNSVAQAVGQRSLGVILTGMGRDGAEGLLAMRRSGAETIGQDENTSLVYGMPRAAFELGGVVKQLPLHRIGAHILNSTNQ
jgi:two-component system chemotaxis response regulator CheB